MMNSREIIRKVIAFEAPPRIGLDFNLPNQKDIAWISAARLIGKKYQGREEWGRYEEELKAVPGFQGEIRRDAFGNIYGRLEGKTNGECIKGALEDGWELLDDYEMPQYDESYVSRLREIFQQNEGRFLLGALPVSPFSTSRDLRKIDRFLMDTVLEEEQVQRLLSLIRQFALELIHKAGCMGFDGIVIYDDWGTQSGLLINPAKWRQIFKPIYTALAAAVHEHNMKFFLHSCGYVYEVIEDMIDAGIDVLQFDQPELVGSEKLTQEFGGRVTFWCPVDIQKVLQTGNRELIEETARKMLRCFGKFPGGFIAKDYPSLKDINVKEEWAQWARDVFIKG